MLVALHTLGAGLAPDACPEFELSDQSGLFPYHSEDALWNQQWLPSPAAMQDPIAVPFDAMDMLVHLPAGVSPASVRH
eukprot:2077550-Rhodomonas_salina.1